MAACVGAARLPARRCSSPQASRAAPIPSPTSPRALQDAVVNISTTQTLKGLGRERAERSGPQGLAVRGVLRRFLRRRGQGRPAAQSELARLGLRHRPVGPGRHQQSRDRGRRRDHHQLHRRHQAEGHQDPRPRSQDRPRAAQGRAEEAAQGRHLRRFLEDARRRLGDGDRQSVRPRRQRHRRHHLRHQARHQCRAL